jgi:hypothetical protein
MVVKQNSQHNPIQAVVDTFPATKNQHAADYAPLAAPHNQ